MSVPRRVVVNALVDGAMAGMTAQTEALGANGNEVISACMSIAARAVHVARELGGDLSVVRVALESMLLECADERRGN